MLWISWGFPLLLIVPLSSSSSEVCYGDLGCFETGDVWFHLLLRPVPAPEHPKELNTSFHFYDAVRAIENLTIISWPNLEGLINLRVDCNRPLYVLTHGFGSSGEADWMQSLKNTFTKELKGQVILVNWEIGGGKNYLQSASNTRTLGAEIARLLKAINRMGYPYKKMHLIGHSLGAQASAYASKSIANMSIGRLTGLDPAQPCFEGLNKKVHISKGDAKFVDILHTSARPFLPSLGFGLIDTVGDVDFYINGGAYQPGCLDIYQHINETGIVINSLADLANVTVEVLQKIITCSHGRSYWYFEEAIKPNNTCHFWAKKEISKFVYEDTKDKGGVALKKVTPPIGIGPIKGFVNFGKPLASSGLAQAETVINASSGKILPSIPCSKETCTIVGLNTFKFLARGSVFVNTGEESPYCIDDPGATKTLEKNLEESDELDTEKYVCLS